jgi:energy-coupling factor transporter ATP-binding protein EcfA2
MLTLKKGGNNIRICCYLLKPNDPNAANTTINEIYVQEQENPDDVIQVKYNIPPSRFLDYNTAFSYHNERYPMTADKINNIVMNLNNPLANKQVDQNQFEHVKTMVHQARMYEFHAALNKEFRICPTMRRDQRDYFLLCGNSGCGKSTVAAQIAEMFNYTYPDYTIYLITNKPADPKFDVFPFIKRIPKEEWREFIGIIKPEKKRSKKYDSDEAEEEEETKDISDYAKSLFIFDDIEDILESALQKLVRRFKDLLVRVGRSYQIHVIWCLHIFADRENTKKDLQEATAIVLFPKDSTTYHIEYFLKYKLGIDDYNIDKIRNATDRWVMFYKYQPRCCVTSSKVWIIKPKPKAMKKMK